MPFDAFVSHEFSGRFAGQAWTLALDAPSWSSDLQPQFIISIVRLGLVLILPGFIWLLWHSTILTERKRNAAIIAGFVRLLFSLGADLALVHAGVYKYALDTQLYQGVPVDFHVVYACIWGTAFCLLWEEASSLLGPILLVAAVALMIIWERWLSGSPRILVPLAPEWQTWDLVVQCALPVVTVLFYKLVDENRALALRTAIYSLGYFGVFYFLIPSIILQMSTGTSTAPGTAAVSASNWRMALAAAAILSFPGAWAAGQFAISGRGTPFPLDPTHKLIVTGPYAFVRNPMQISGLGVSVVWAAATGSAALWIYVGVFIIALQFLKVHEEDNLHRRFGERYKKYCKRVWLWLPRLWPYEEE